MSSGAAGMPPDRLVRCFAGPDEGAASGRLSFQVDGRGHAVSLRIDRLARQLVADLPDHMVDLLEIAAYVYAADAAIRRGGPSDRQLGADWRRRLRFEIPVRVPDLWNGAEIRSLLEETLGVLTEDEYAFSFVPSSVPSAPERYFRFPDDSGFEADEVLLFSGGLDSLAGALEEVVRRGNRAVLVSHHSSTKLQKVQSDLVADLQKQVGANRLLHVPVTMQMRTGSNRETTHRARSFFFAAMGIVAATMFGRNRVRFYENGVVSINLPPSGQAVGARATRSTHPQVLDGFSRLFSTVLGHRVVVDNPFLLKTKTEIVETIRDLGAQDMIRYTRSCAEVRKMTNMHPHCGRCSQCIDRRFAMLAAGMEQMDPDMAYAVDPLTGPRMDVRDREIALGYAHNARFYAGMTPADFVRTFGEIQRAMAHLDQPVDAAVERLFRLHRRHGAAVSAVLDRLLASVAADAGRESASDNAPHTDSLVMLAGREIYSGRASGLPVTPSPLPSAEDAFSRIRWTLILHAGGKAATIDGLGGVSGASACVLHDLAQDHLDATGRGLATEDYPLRRASDLAMSWKITEEGVRKRISKLRCRIRRFAVQAGLDPPEDAEIVENVAWMGYRLNPDSVRIVVDRLE